MKKILFQRRNNALFSPMGLLLGVVLIGSILLLILFRLLLPGAFIALTAPLFRAGAFFTSSMAGLTASFTDAALVVRERDALQSQLAALMNENLALQAKNDDLLKLLGDGSGAVRGIVAGVLARPPQSPYDVLIVAVGSTSGVGEGMRVYAAGGVPIGTVESVTASSARIVLYSSGGRTLSAWIGQERVPVTLIGVGGGALTVNAPKASSIALGDTVYAAAGGAVPIGYVADLKDDSSSPSVIVLVKPLINLFEISWVTLVP